MDSKRLWTIVLLSALALLGASCGGDKAASEAFCDAGLSFAESDGTDVAGIQENLNTMVDEAPDEIKDTATAVRDAFAGGDLEAIAAVEDDFNALGEYLEDNCESPED